MSKSIFYSILFFLFITPFFGSSFAQDNEAIVMFLPDVVTLPPGESIAELEEVTISDSEIEAILYDNNVLTLQKAFPDFNLSDTLGLTLNGDTVKFANLYNIYVMEATFEEDIPTLIEELDGFDNIVFIEYNSLTLVTCDEKGINTLSNDPDDPYFQNDLQWNLHQENGDIDIDAPEAWQLSHGNSSTKISIVDLGTSNHEDLRNTHDLYYIGYHGFHVSGIAGARTDNNTGIAGIDWNSQIISHYSYYSDVADVMNVVRDVAFVTQSEIANHSYVFDDGSPMNTEIMRLTYSSVFKKGLTSFCALGNYGNTVKYYPAGYDEWVVGVGSITSAGTKALTSSYGSHLDFVAPGHLIWSTMPGNLYAEKSGTSMAAPHGAGVAGLLIDYFNTLYPNESIYPSDIKNILNNSTMDLDDAGYDIFTGHGLLKAGSALDYIAAPNRLIPVTARRSHQTSITQIGQTYPQWFFGVPGLLDGYTYPTNKYEVNFAIPTPDIFLDIPDVWCKATITAALSSDPSYGIGFFGINSITSSTINGYAYFYEVFTGGGSSVWLPYDPYSTGEDINTGIHLTGAGKVYPDNPVISKDNSSSYAKFTWPAVTGSEIDYYIEKKVGTGNWTFLASTPNTQYTDYTARVIGDGGSKYEYRIRARNHGGTVDYYSGYSNQLMYECRGELWKDQGNDEKIIPDKYELLSNYPNPFNPSTTITFGLPEDASVLLTVYNALGELVAEPVNETMQAGYHSVAWNASDLPSGVYIYKINANEFSAVKKMLLTK